MTRREEIRAGLERSDAFTAVAPSIGRAVSAVSSVTANSDRCGSRAWPGHLMLVNELDARCGARLMGRLGLLVAQCQEQ
jgi:hypothetical protein